MGEGRKSQNSGVFPGAGAATPEVQRQKLLRGLGVGGGGGGGEPGLVRVKDLVLAGQTGSSSAVKNVEGNPRAREAQGCISACRRQRRMERAWLRPSPE